MRALTLADSLRFLRYAYAAGLGIVALLIVAAETLAPRGATEPRAIVNLLYLLAGLDGMIALVYRRKFSGAAAETLRENPEDAAALVSWMKGQLVPLPMALAMGIMGLGARVAGASTLRAAPIYVVSVIVLLALRPSEPGS